MLRVWQGTKTRFTKDAVCATPTQGESPLGHLLHLMCISFLHLSPHPFGSKGSSMLGHALHRVRLDTCAVAARVEVG